MSATASPSPLPSATPPRGAPLSPADLAELLGAFNDVTAKLQRSHDQLTGEVTRLTRELSEANAQLERSRRLAALGEMAAGIAHEVRNPLASIRLYARMLEEDLTDRQDELATAVKITRAVTALDAVVGDVLAFSRELRISRRELDAAELLEKAVEACGGEGVWRGVRVRGPRHGVRIVADPGLAQQAVVNVVRNALEAMTESSTESGGGDHTLTLAARREDGAAVLTVADTGPGVSPEIVARMFNPFFTTRGTGTGLGLSIVHRIMDAHGGRVSVGNGGRGAIVEMTFPDGDSQTMERT